MSGNNYWKRNDGKLAITTQENNSVGEEWVKISYEEYLKLIHPEQILTDGQ